MPFTYSTAQGLINFGRQFAANLIGQPFEQYRLSGASSGDPIAPENLVGSINSKITHTRQMKDIENDYLHTNPFEFLIDMSAVELGDILVQNDPAYGGNTQYAIASRRPLKPTLAVRVETLANIYQASSGRSAGGYAGASRTNGTPYVLTNGVFAPSTIGNPSNIPVGIQYIGQMKVQNNDRLPLDDALPHWFCYLPFLPGLDGVRENDIIQVQAVEQNAPMRFRINAMQPQPGWGLSGYFCTAVKELP